MIAKISFYLLMSNLPSLVLWSFANTLEWDVMCDLCTRRLQTCLFLPPICCDDVFRIKFISYALSFTESYF